VRGERRVRGSETVGVPGRVRVVRSACFPKLLDHSASLRTRGMRSRRAAGAAAQSARTPLDLAAALDTTGTAPPAVPAYSARISFGLAHRRRLNSAVAADPHRVARCEAWHLRRLSEHDPARTLVSGFPSSVTWGVREALASAPMDDAVAHGPGTPRPPMVEEDSEASVVGRHVLVPSTGFG
jgi:hypothetical protein